MKKLDERWLDTRVSSSVRFSRRTFAQAAAIAEKEGIDRNKVLELMIAYGLAAYQAGLAKLEE